MIQYAALLGYEYDNTMQNYNDAYFWDTSTVMIIMIISVNW